jgi:hypothetical protein
MLGRSVAFTRSEIERIDSAIRAAGYDGPMEDMRKERA